MVSVVNLGNSNIQSVVNALNYLDIEYVVTDNYRDIKKNSKIILPGVGSFGNGVDKLKELNLFQIIQEEVICKKKAYFRYMLRYATSI